MPQKFPLGRINYFHFPCSAKEKLGAQFRHTEHRAFVFRRATYTTLNSNGKRRTKCFNIRFFLSSLCETTHERIFISPIRRDVEFLMFFKTDAKFEAK